MATPLLITKILCGDAQISFFTPSEVIKMYEVKEDFIVYAFRYALGRKTYAVGDVSDYLIDNWHRFSKHIQSQIVEEIEQAIERGEAGMECDEKLWKRILLLHNAVREGQL